MWRFLFKFVGRNVSKWNDGWWKVVEKGYENGCEMGMKWVVKMVVKWLWNGKYDYEHMGGLKVFFWVNSIVNLQSNQSIDSIAKMQSKKTQKTRQKFRLFRLQKCNRSNRNFRLQNDNRNHPKKKEPVPYTHPTPPTNLRITKYNDYDP